MRNYFVDPTAVIDAGAQIGEGCKIWHFSHIMAGAIIGDGCTIGQNVLIAPKVRIGKGSKIQNNVSVYTGVICEDEVFLGPSCVFTNVSIPRSYILKRDQYEETLVGRGATIGANATIICGHRIGRYAFVGAGAVVTSDVADYALVVGNPAKRIAWVSRAGERLSFDNNGFAICPYDGYRYRLTGDTVTLESPELA